MFAEDLEFCFLAHLFDDVYKISRLPEPSIINWGRFEKLARNNKVELLAYTKVLEDATLNLPSSWQDRFQASKRYQEVEGRKLAPSLQQAKLILGDTPYVLVKTYRPFSYFTHDIDLLVTNTEPIGEAVTGAGIEWEDIPKKSVQIEQEQWLDIEFYERVLPGSIQVIDDELTLLNSIPITFQGVRINVASPEIEIITLLADAVFRLYELKLGDMIYIYTLAPKADWDVLIYQAQKHHWYRSFKHIVGVLNAYHREIYGQPSPMETYVPVVKSVQPSAPYVSGWVTTCFALYGKGARHLIKMPAYFSVVLKQNHPKLHRFYVRFFQVPVGRFTLKYIYR